MIILPLLSTLVNHTKTILVQNLVFCMIPRDSGMQCSGFVIPLMCRILNRGLGYGTTSGCTRRWPPQWKSSAQHWPMERPSAVTLLSISHRKPHFFYRTLHHTLSSSALLFSHLPKGEEKSTWLCVILLLLVVGLVTTLFTDSSSLEHKAPAISEILPPWKIALPSITEPNSFLVLLS